MSEEQGIAGAPPGLLILGKVRAAISESSPYISSASPLPASQSSARSTANTPFPLARLILNYKNLPYTTHWLEYPQIAPHLSSLGIPPNPSSSGIASAYSVPTIRLPDGTYIMDSKRIAAALEERYPDPPLHIDAPQVAQIEGLLPKMLGPMRGITMPKIPRALLNQESAAFFNETRAQRFGMSLEQLEREKGGEAQWEEAGPVIREIGEMLRENDGGPFVRGKEVSYADFYLVGLLVFFERLGEGVLERFVGIEPALGRLWEGSRGLVERDT
ncbi:MAG: hypothetical protein Q9208_004199 [Pyrenodesmia sp. 3 TL-2023]